MKRRHLLLAALLTLLATIGAQPLVGQDALTPRQLRVIWTTTPDTHATVSWTTTELGDDHVVHYDVVARDGVAADYTFTTDVIASGEYQDDGPYFHHATLTDLPPNTDVYFSVETDGNLSDELYFRTAPDGEETIKLLYGGDSRTGQDERQEMNRLIARMHGEDPEIIALVHGGDYIAWANAWFQWTAWLDDHELTIGADGRVLPIIPAKGNHEGRGVVYNRVFGNPSGDPDKNWFYTRFGQLALINLDTEASLAGEQREWLEERLQEGRDARWLMVNYHRPAFPAVKTPSGAREHWVPLFEQYNVDLVCESDGHTLKRTPPIRNEAVDATGVIYVGEGGLGVPQRTPKYDRWYLQPPGMAASAHHVQKIELTPDQLIYEAVTMDGTVVDAIQILPVEQRLNQQFGIQRVWAPTPEHIVLQLTAPFAPDTALDGEWSLDPSLDVKRVSIGDEVTAVLRVVNSATPVELDETIGLDVRAARNILTYRAGDDVELGTDDDRQFETWAELDAVGYVGDSALGKLSDYALADDENAENLLTLRVERLDEGEAYDLRVPPVATLDGAESLADGTAINVTYVRPDDRADAIAQDPNLVQPDEEAAGCSTSATSRGTDLGWMLFLIGFWSVRRCRKKSSISSESPKTTAGSHSRR